MANCGTLIEQKRAQRGIPIAELGRRVDMTPELLRRSLRGDRELRADEFIRLTRELDMTLAEFSDVS